MRRRTLYWMLGVLAQSVILGTLLFFALFRLAGVVGGARVFRYQGF